MPDLFLNRSLACGGAPVNATGDGGPDPAGLNALLRRTPYRETTRITASEKPWAAQLVTTVAPDMIVAYNAT
jgi:hypothetical protein